MAEQIFNFNVTGVQELRRNLEAFGSPRMLQKILSNAMRAGATIAQAQARANARGQGLDRVGFVSRGRGKGQRRVYGRIPRSIKTNRIYIPRGSPDQYRMNVVARGQRWPGIYKAKAPHAQLIEYGFRHLASGRRIAARPFIGPALDTTAGRVIEAIAQRMQGQIDGLKFPTTGLGP